MERGLNGYNGSVRIEEIIYIQFLSVSIRSIRVNPCSIGVGKNQAGDSFDFNLNYSYRRESTGFARAALMVLGKMIVQATVNIKSMPNKKGPNPN